MSNEDKIVLNYLKERKNRIANDYVHDCFKAGITLPQPRRYEYDLLCELIQEIEQENEGKQ